MPIYIRELFGMLRAEKLTAVDDDLEPVPSPKFKRIPKRHRFVESRVGQRDVASLALRCCDAGPSLPPDAMWSLEVRRRTPEPALWHL